MKFSDLLRMSGSNLLRRKLRTALTCTGSGHRNCVDRGYDFPRSGTSEKLLGSRSSSMEV